jgi:hypothetical protein
LVCPASFGSKKKVANVTMLTMIRIKTVAIRRRTIKVTISVTSNLPGVSCDSFHPEPELVAQPAAHLSSRRATPGMIPASRLARGSG